MRRMAAIVGALVLAGGIVGPGTALAAVRCHGEPATIVGTAGDDDLRGTNGRDVIAGLGGNDSIDALRGDDLVCGGEGGDVIDGGEGTTVAFGGKGSDTVWGGRGNDELHGGPGDDWLIGGAGDDVLSGGKGANDVFEEAGGSDVIDGGPGTGDIANYSREPSAVTVDLAAGTAEGDGSDSLSEVEAVWGSQFDDVITGDGLPNEIQGLGGDDRISSGGGGSLECEHPQPANMAPMALLCADILAGNEGNDVLNGGDGLDVLDTFNGPAVVVDLGAGTATGDGSDTLSGIEGAWGSAETDTLIGDSGDNVFVVWAGDDIVRGGAGTDLVAFHVVGSVSVDLTAGAATAEKLGVSGTWAYTLSGIEDAWAVTPEWGASEPDVLVGDAGPNDLRGFDGDDTISGAGGDDALDGGEGEDTLDGGPGTDTCLNGELVTGCET